MGTKVQTVAVHFPEAGQRIEARVIRPHQLESGDLIDRGHNANICLRLPVPVPRGRWEVLHVGSVTRE